MTYTNGRRTLHAVCTGVLVLALAVCLARAARTRSRDDWQKPDRVMRDLDLEEGGTVADVGCGRGYFTFRMAREVGKDGRVLAVDISRSALKTVREKAKRRDLENISTTHSKPDDALLPAASVDAALLSLVLHHAADEAKDGLMASIAKGLKPGGYLYILEFRRERDTPFHDYEELVALDEVVELAEKAGLELDAEFFYLPHQYFLRFRRPVE